MPTDKEEKKVPIGQSDNESQEEEQEETVVSNPRPANASHARDQMSQLDLQSKRSSATKNSQSLLANYFRQKPKATAPNQSKPIEGDQIDSRSNRQAIKRPHIGSRAQALSQLEARTVQSEKPSQPKKNTSALFGAKKPTQNLKKQQRMNEEQTAVKPNLSQSRSTSKDYDDLQSNSQEAIIDLEALGNIVEQHLEEEVQPPTTVTRNFIDENRQKLKEVNFDFTKVPKKLSAQRMLETILRINELFPPHNVDYQAILDFMISHNPDIRPFDDEAYWVGLKERKIAKVGKQNFDQIFKKDNDTEGKRPIQYMVRFIDPQTHVQGLHGIIQNVKTITYLGQGISEGQQQLTAAKNIANIVLALNPDEDDSQDYVQYPLEAYAAMIFQDSNQFDYPDEFLQTFNQQAIIYLDGYDQYRVALDAIIRSGACYAQIQEHIREYIPGYTIKWM